MPVTTKHKKVKLPFFTFQVPVGWEHKPLTAAQKKARKKDREKARQERAAEAAKALKEHEEAQRAAAKTTAPAATAPAAPGGLLPTTRAPGAAVMGPKGRVVGANKAAAKRTTSSQLCGAPNKTTGGTCKRPIAVRPCPDHGTTVGSR